MPHLAVADFDQTAEHCAACGKRVGVAPPGALLCECHEPILLAADDAPLQLDWGTRDVRESGPGLVASTSGVFDPLPAQPGPVASPAPNVEAAAPQARATGPTSALRVFEVCTQLISLFLVMAAVFEFVCVGSAALYLFAFWLGWKPIFVLIPAASREAIWCFLLCAVSAWTILCMRVQEQRGEAPVLPRLAALLAMPLLPPAGIRVFKTLFPDPRTAGLALGMQICAVTAAVAWIAMPGLQLQRTGVFWLQAGTGAAICAAMLITRMVMLEVERFESACALEWRLQAARSPISVKATPTASSPAAQSSKPGARLKSSPGVDAQLRPARTNQPPAAPAIAHNARKAAAIVAVIVAAIAGAATWWKMRALSSVEIAARVKASVVTVSCNGQTGTGFFIAPTLVLTRQHLACGAGENPKVTHGDGRATTGSPRPGAGAFALWEIAADGSSPPMRLGDATETRKGEPVWWVDAISEHELNLRQATLGQAGLIHRGVAYLLIDAEARLGSGSPLLNRYSEVIGIVAPRIDEAQGLGLAVPVNYLAGSSALRDWAVRLPRSTKAWDHLENNAEADVFDSLRQWPEVVDVRLDGAQLSVEAMLRAPSGARPLTLTAQAQSYDGTKCFAFLDLKAWEPMASAADRVPWMAQHDLLSSLYIATATTMPGCEIHGSGELIIYQGSHELTRETYDRP